MKEIRLIRLLKTLNREELRSLRKFVLSSFSGHTRNIIPLFDYLFKFHPGFDSPRLIREEIFKSLFGDETYSEGKLQNLISDLTKSAECYLAHSTFEKDELEVLLNLSKGYLEKNLFTESDRINKLIEKKLKPSFSPNKDYVSKLKRLNYLKFAYNTKTNNFSSLHEDLEKFFEALIIQFIFEYTLFADNMKIGLKDSRRKLESELIKNVIKNFDFEKLLKLLEKGDYINTDDIGLHYYRIKTSLYENEHKYYNLLKRLLLKNLSAIDREDKWFFFVHLLNYCEQKKLNNVKAFEKESVEIYRSIVENNAFSPSEKEFMDLRFTRNLILCCFAQKESGWLNYFLDNYLKYLNPDDVSRMEIFGFAHLYFIQGEFEKSLEYAKRIDNEFFFFKADVKNLLLKVYFELEYFEDAFHLIDAYKHFIDENKELPEVFKEVYRNYLRLYSRILKLKNGESKDDPVMVKMQIENEAHPGQKGWLIEKAEEQTKKNRSYDKALKSI